MTEAPQLPADRRKGETLRAWLRDLAGLGGVASATAGAWLIYPPAALLLFGFFLLAGAWVAARNDGNDDEAE